MKKFNNSLTNPQWIPDNLPTNQIPYWGNLLHFEEENKKFQFVVENFPNNDILCKELNMAWRPYFASGAISVINDSTRTKYIFNKYEANVFNKELYLEFISKEYNVINWVGEKIAPNYINAVNTNIAHKSPISKRTYNTDVSKKCKEHYGSNYNENICKKEYAYQKTHGGMCTWEDPNYNQNKKDLENLRAIENMNRPVRNYMKKNMKIIWEDYEHDRKKAFENKGNNSTKGKLEYAKYCSDYIKNNWYNQGKIPWYVIKDWKHYSSFIK